ncbi:MAG: VRR-NUC domain-containing protein, partial [Candidatus Heimdallarchaeota archaeon]|nr:VRR-NUC domain-containing protein [Candidatus Heimdallarchaeota archaeon]
MKRNNEEHQIQVGLFQWIDLQMNVYPALKNAFAIPNGGSRNDIEAKNLKNEGVRSGVPDVCLAYPSNGFHGLFIEHKS